MTPSSSSRFARALAAALPALLLLASAAIAQQGAVPEPSLRRIPLGDSLNLRPNQVSISPDRRWVVVARNHPTGSDLWAVPTQGGAPVRLTSGGYEDSWPSWSPAGDRIFFVSNRPVRGSDRPSPVMALSFDAKTGRAVGSPRQVTLEGIVMQAGVRVSPDGKSMAYVQSGSKRLKVVPTAGGSPRVVAETENTPAGLTWSSDGKHIYFTMVEPGSMERLLLRVPSQGGKPEELFRTKKMIRRIGPDARLLALLEPGPTARSQTLEIVDRRGSVLARRTISGDMAFFGGFSEDGRSLVGSENDVVAPIRVMSVGGARPRDVVPSPGYHWPLGWTRDGRHVVAASTVNDRAAIVVAPAAGGAARQILLPRGVRQQNLETVVGDHVLAEVDSPEKGRRKLLAIDLRTGEQRELTSRATFIQGTLPMGAGGAYLASGDEFLYLEQNGDALEFRASTPAGRTRLLRSFPMSMAGKTHLAAHGDRVAYCQVVGDSAALMIADGPTAAPRRIAMLSPQQKQANCSGSIGWSHDGRWIATHHDDTRIAVVDTRPSGQATRPRIIDTGMLYWYEPRWLPDNSGFTIIGGGEGSQTQVLLVSLREGESPVNITRDDPAPKWGHTLSPDGRLVAYPAEIWRGSSLWIMDLPAPPASFRPAARPGAGRTR